LGLAARTHGRKPVKIELSLVRWAGRLAELDRIDDVLSTCQHEKGACGRSARLWALVATILIVATLLGFSLLQH
jgi:hypothetical protein